MEDVVKDCEWKFFGSFSPNSLFFPNDKSDNLIFQNLSILQNILSKYIKTFFSHFETDN